VKQGGRATKTDGPSAPISPRKVELPVNSTARGWTSRGQPKETPEGRQRKHQVLSQHKASVADGIADAVVTKDGPLFFLSRPDGDVPLGAGHGLGLYFHDCRYLSGLELRLDGQLPKALAASAGEGFRAVIELTNPALAGAGGRSIGEDSLGVQLVRTLDGDARRMHQTIAVHNYALDPVELDVALAFGAGFEDVFAIRGLWPEQRGKLLPASWGDGSLRFAYEGADRVRRELSVEFDPAPTDVGVNSARFDMRIGGSDGDELKVIFTVNELLPAAERPPRSGRGKLRHSAEGGDRWLQDAMQVRSNSMLLNATLERSLRDIQALRTQIGSDDYVAAGVPWFATLFGRDALITALQVLSFDPGIAAQTLRVLAARQGQTVDKWRDEEPGKILHELRIGELARLGLIPHSPYYGSVDATPLFLILLARHASWTGSLALFEELHDAVNAALEWMETYADRNKDGYIEYRSPSGEGLANQGWKDSGDAIVNADGSLARPPISMVEVQGYAYAARIEIADLYERVGDRSRAESLRATASDLRHRLNHDFYLADLGTYALALQKGGAPCSVIASNAGHLLWTGAADKEKAESTVKVLMAPDMFNGWGVRTLSTRERRYNPIGYHLGTIWPHDNDLIVAGFRRYRQDDAALQLATALLDAAMHFHEYQLPEAFAGYERMPFAGPVRYPVACHPQAWAAGTPPHLLETLLGLQPDGFARRLRVVRPLLPDFVDLLELEGLLVGDARIDLTFQRTSGAVEVRTDKLMGDLDLEIVTTSQRDAGRE
jgi:glycogen debranching enzyme